MQLMTVVIHLMFGCMFCHAHFFFIYTCTTFHQHLIMLANLNLISKLSYNLLFTHFTLVCAVWVFHLQCTTKLLNGTSFFCLEAFNTLSLSLPGLQNDGGWISTRSTITSIPKASLSAPFCKTIDIIRKGLETGRFNTN